MTNPTRTPGMPSSQQQINDSNHSPNSTHIHTHMHSVENALPAAARLPSSPSQPNLKANAVRPVFKAYLDAPFHDHFIAASANHHLNRLFQTETLSTPNEPPSKHYPNTHPFSEHFFDGKHSEAALRQKCNTLCDHIITSLESHLNNSEKLNYFSQRGLYRDYLLSMCDNPRHLLPLLKETASYAHLLLNHLDRLPSTDKQEVEAVLAIFPPNDLDDYHCISGTRTRLVEAFQFFNRNSLDTTASLPTFLRKEISNAVQDYVAQAVVQYQLSDYVNEEYEVHLTPMLTAYLVGRKAIEARDDYALEPRKGVPAHILYQIINEAPTALHQRTEPLNSTITDAATQLLSRIEECNDFFSASAGLQLNSIREQSINELMREYTTFEPTGDAFIELDADSMPKRWNIKKLERTISSTLSRHILKTSKSDIQTQRQPVHYRDLFKYENMLAVATQISRCHTETEYTRPISSTLIPLHVMTTAQVGGSLLYTLLILRMIGQQQIHFNLENDRGALKDHTSINNSTLINNNTCLNEGLSTLRRLARNSKLPALDRDRLSDIVETIKNIIKTSNNSQYPNHVNQNDPDGYSHLLHYFNYPKEYFGVHALLSTSNKDDPPCLQLVDELFRANAPVRFWEPLLSEPMFLKALTHSDTTSLPTQPHPEVESLVLLFYKTSPKFLSKYLPHLMKGLIGLNDIDTIERISQLNIPPKMLLGERKTTLNTVQYAAICNKPQVIHLLHKAGLSVQTLLRYNTMSGNGYSATEWAVLRNHPNIIEIFSKLGATAQQLDPAGATPWYRSPPTITLTALAACENSVEALQALINAGLTDKQMLRMDREGSLPHFIAAEKGHAEILKILAHRLSPKALFQAHEDNGKRPLMRAAILGGTYGPGNNRDVLSRWREIAAY